MNLFLQYQARVRAQKFNRRMWAAQPKPRARLTFREEQECTNQVAHSKEQCGPERTLAQVFSLSSSWAKVSSSTPSQPDPSPAPGGRSVARSISASEADI